MTASPSEAAWRREVEASLASHPSGASLTQIAVDTGAAPTTIVRVLEWLDRDGRVALDRAIGGGVTYRLVAR